ncbi:MAG: hypothetical protein MZU95_16405 [Desulfomicrobium escambiense]|nr:hypothetical protein [Desulfomicrobium escambiense]
MALITSIRQSRLLLRIGSILRIRIVKSSHSLLRLKAGCMNTVCQVSMRFWISPENLSFAHALIRARRRNPCPLLLGWMELFVAAAHACVLPANVTWFQGAYDPMNDLNAADWPDAVVIQEPGCSSRFHSYTAAAATHAVAIVAEQAIKLIDAPESALEFSAGCVASSIWMATGPI